MQRTRYIIQHQNGFTIPKKVYQNFIQENNVSTKIQHLLGTITDEEKSVEKASKHIQQLILSTPLHSDVTQEIFHAYALLSGILTDAKVLVQSPQGKASIHGEATLLTVVKDMWAAIFNPESILLHKDNLSSLLKKDIDIEVGYEHKTDTMFSSHDALHESEYAVSPTATKLYVTVEKAILASDIAKRSIDGVGLLQSEFILRELAIHPKTILKDGKKKKYVEQLAERIASYAKSFSPRPVVYQLSNFTTDDYRHLENGEFHEKKETNSTLGYRGALRFIHDPELFHIELEALKYVRDRLGYKNVWVTLPFVRTVAELTEIKKHMTDEGLYRSPSLQLWMNIQVPANSILLEKFVEEGIDGIAIDPKSLTMLILGADPQNDELETAYDMQNEAVLWAIEKAIKTAHKFHITSSFYQTTPLPFSVLEQLIRWGVTSISVDPENLTITKKQVAETEQNLISKDRLQT